MEVKADNILIKPVPWPERKIGLIVLPDNDKARAMLGRGEIIAMGPGTYTQQGIQLPPEMKIGEYAYYLSRSRVPVVIDGYEMDLVPEREIVMTLTAEEIGKSEGESTDAT